VGKRGPKPRPTKLRVLDGNPSKTPINDAEPVPEGTAQCPEHLSEDAKACWKVIIESLPPGMISAADGPLLATYCECWATHKAACEALAADRDLMRGQNLTTPSGKPSPYIRIMSDMSARMAALSSRLGLSPADRANLKLGNGQGTKGKWAGLIA